MADIAFRMLISPTLKDPVNMVLVMFCDPENIARGGVWQPMQCSKASVLRSSRCFLEVLLRASTH